MSYFLGITDYKVTRVGGGVRDLRNEGTGEVHGREGFVSTPLGYVSVFGYAMRDGSEFWSFSVIMDGREYRYRERRLPSERLTESGVKTVAHRWIKRVHRRLATPTPITGGSDGE